jgi:cobalt-zinc-cadmium efflux system protein
MSASFHSRTPHLEDDGHHHDDDHDRQHEHKGHNAHGHHHHHHGHNHGAGVANERRLAFAFFIILIFMLVEVVGGMLSGSLALLADAGHMVSDAIALGMSWMALRIGKRPADRRRSYGYKRLEVLVAFVNGCTLFGITAWIFVEAIRRFMSPVEVLGGSMLVVAVIGLFANFVAFMILHGGSQENLNVRSAWLHVLGDLLGFVVAIVAALIIVFTHWSPVDPILSIVVALLILKGAYEIVRSSAHILLEGVPPGVDLEVIRTDLIEVIPAVNDVHHVHAWSLSSEETLVTLHVRCDEKVSSEGVVPAVCERLNQKFGIHHATVQVEHGECHKIPQDVLSCDIL